MPINIPKLVASVKKITRSLGLLVAVSYEPYTGDDEFGNSEYGSKVTLSVAMEYKNRFTASSELGGQMSTHNLTILEPMGINVKDRFTLPDGSTPQIMSTEGPMLTSGIPVTRVYF